MKRLRLMSIGAEEKAAIDTPFRTGPNVGAERLREAMCALYNGIRTDDVSGESLDGGMVAEARKV